MEILHRLLIFFDYISLFWRLFLSLRCSVMLVTNVSYFMRSSRSCEVENDYTSSEDGLRELAPGVKRSFDVGTYVRSPQGKLIKVSTKAARQSSRLAELPRQRGSIKEEYEWYGKQCMRKRITVPYFQNIADSCHFLMKKDLVDEANTNIRGKSLACQEINSSNENEESYRSY